MSELTKQLQRARKAKHLSQKDLGDRLGFPQSHISAIETGKVDLRTKTLVEIARSLGLEPMLIPPVFVPAVKSLISGKNQLEPLWKIDEEDA